MTARELTALRCMPAEYVEDGTMLCTFNGWVVAVNGQAPLPVMKWHEDSGWTILEFQEEAPLHDVVFDPTFWTRISQNDLKETRVTHATLYVCRMMLGCEPNELPEPIASELVAFLMRYQENGERFRVEWHSFSDRLEKINRGGN